MLSVDKSLSEKNAIGIGRKGTINKPQLLHAPFWTVDTLFYLTPKANNNLIFLFYLFQNINWSKYDESTGLPSLSKKTINNIKKNIPSNSEQKKIGNLLSKIDTAVTLLQKELELKIALEQYLRKHLLTILKNNVPILRLKKYKYSWKNKSLEEVANIKTGSRNHQDSVPNGKYPFFVRSANIEHLNEYDFDEKAILVPGDGKIGEIFHYYEGKFALHQRVYKIDKFKEIDPKFLLNLFKNSFKKHAIRLNAQGTVPSLRLPMFTNWKIYMPTLSEQKQIASILSSVEKSIENDKNKIKSLDALKQFLLQNMFI